MEAKEIQAISSTLRCKVPEFYPTNPSAWFLSLDTIFELSNITSEKTKFKHLIGSLATSVVAEIQDIITEVSADKPYTDAKQAIIKRFQPSPEESLRKLLSEVDLEDQKPSKLLRRMKELAGFDVKVTDSPLFKEAFFMKLPQTVRAVLATWKNQLTLTQLADRADEVMAVTTEPETTTAATVQELEAKVAQLAAELNHLNTQDRVQPQNLSTQRSFPRRSRSPSPFRSRYQPGNKTRTSRSGICYYHLEFGRRARKCLPPCSFPRLSEN